MINNIQNLFTKYTSKLNSKKEIEDKTILFIKEKINIDLSNKNLKIDIKNKQIKLINLNSSLRFILFNKLNKDLIEEFKIKNDYNLIFN